MKKLLLSLLVCFAVLCTSAQTSTYILVRHAEKDTSSKTDPNPALSTQGQKRALSLVDALKDYKIDAVYSTNYTRTKSTVEPVAQKLGKEIQVYNPTKAFAEELLQQKGKTILVAGHSNTTPALANLLLKEKKFEPLDESVYNKIFVVTVDGDKAEVKVLEY